MSPKLENIDPSARPRTSPISLSRSIFQQSLQQSEALQGISYQFVRWGVGTAHQARDILSLGGMGAFISVAQRFEPLPHRLCFSAHRDPIIKAFRITPRGKARSAFEVRCGCARYGLFRWPQRRRLRDGSLLGCRRFAWKCCLLRLSGGCLFFW